MRTPRYVANSAFAIGSPPSIIFPGSFKNRSIQAGSRRFLTVARSGPSESPFPIVWQAAQRVWKTFPLPGSEILQHASLNFVSRDNPFSSARAERELGWSPVVAPADAIPDAFRWWARERRRWEGG